MNHVKHCDPTSVAIGASNPPPQLNSGETQQNVEQYFSSFRQELGALLVKANSMYDRISVTESYLLRRLERGFRTNNNMMNAVYTMINSRGVITVEDLQISSGLGSRQLERLFQEYIGVSPKKAADLVRFQNVWKDLYLSSTEPKSIQDIIFEYRFSHQSHFINRF